ncbi:MAG: hypothetical protein AAF628_26845 [Planctomycetota bacterium]
MRYLTPQRAVVEFSTGNETKVRCLALGRGTPLPAGSYGDNSCTRTATKKIPALFIKKLRKFIYGDGKTGLHLPQDSYRGIEGTAGRDEENIRVVVIAPTKAPVLIPVSLAHDAGSAVRAWTSLPVGAAVGVESGFSLSSFQTRVSTDSTISLGEVAKGGFSLPTFVRLSAGNTSASWLLFPQRRLHTEAPGIAVAPAGSQADPAEPGDAKIIAKIANSMTAERLGRMMADVRPRLLKDNAMPGLFAAGTCIVAVVIAPKTAGFSMTVCHGATEALFIGVATSLPKHLMAAAVEHTTELTDSERQRARNLVRNASLVIDFTTVVKDMYDFKRAQNTAKEVAAAVSAALGTAKMTVREKDGVLSTSIGSARDNLGRLVIIMEALPVPK